MRGISFDESGPSVQAVVDASALEQDGPGPLVRAILNRMKEHLKWEVDDTTLDMLTALIIALNDTKVDAQVRDAVSKGTDANVFTSPIVDVAVAHMPDEIHGRKINGVIYFDKKSGKFIIGVERTLTPFRASLAFWHEVVHLAEMLVKQKNSDHAIHNVTAFLFAELLPELAKLQEKP